MALNTRWSEKLVDVCSQKLRLSRALQFSVCAGVLRQLDAFEKLAFSRKFCVSFVAPCSTLNKRSSEPFSKTRCLEHCVTLFVAYLAKKHILFSLHFIFQTMSKMTLALEFF